MQIMAWAGVILVGALIPIVGCRKSVTVPIYRRPVISSVVAFPTSLGPGDSTLITVNATDPDGDSLVYDWEAVNGLLIKGDVYVDGLVYNTHDNSRIFYRSTTWPYPNDTAYVWCTVRDRTGGSDSRRVFIPFLN